MLTVYLCSCWRWYALDSEESQSWLILLLAQSFSSHREQTESSVHLVECSQPIASEVPCHQLSLCPQINVQNGNLETDRLSPTLAKVANFGLFLFYRAFVTTLLFIDLSVSFP